MTITAFSDELAQVRTKKKEFLSQIEQIVPWEEWLATIQPCYYKGERGNKPYPLEIMLRLYILQNLYDLSDEATVRRLSTAEPFQSSAGWIPTSRFQTGIRWPFSESADLERTARKTFHAGGWGADGTRSHSEERDDCGSYHHICTLFRQRAGRRSGIRRLIKSRRGILGTLGTRRISVWTGTAGWFTR